MLAIEMHACLFIFLRRRSDWYVRLAKSNHSSVPFALSRLGAILHMHVVIDLPFR
jgi:hypothetical protein